MKSLYFLFILLAFCCCKTKNQAEVLAPEIIINKSIEVSGGHKISKSIIGFNFRNLHYKATRNNGVFSLVRVTVKDNDSIFDVLTNKGFERIVNNKLVKVVDSMIPRYSSLVNSVHYFSILPFGLNDEAVNKQYLCLVDIKGVKYHKIKVTFNKDKGGEDYEDVFVYWINEKTYKTEFIAYSYIENDALGFRFREANNERYVNGIRFVDYNNYKPQSTIVSPIKLDELFKKNELVLVSKIELKNIKVD